jgi:hypothetical protein
MKVAEDKRKYSRLILKEPHCIKEEAEHIGKFRYIVGNHKLELEYNYALSIKNTFNEKLC